MNPLLDYYLENLISLSLANDFIGSLLEIVDKALK